MDDGEMNEEEVVTPQVKVVGCVSTAACLDLSGFG